MFLNNNNMHAFLEPMFQEDTKEVFIQDLIFVS